MKLPFYDNDIKTITLVKHVTTNGTFELKAIPLWPCYEEDGARKVMDISLQLWFHDNHNGSYIMEEYNYEE